jgi:integrase
LASIFKTTDGTWRVQIRKRGVTDSRNFSRKIDATTWATMRERDIDLGDAGLQRKPSGTLDDLLREYHRIVYPLKRYSRSKIYDLDQLARDLGTLPVAAITTQRVVEYATTLRQRMAGSAILNRLSYLRETLRAANDLWDANAPVAQVDEALAALKRQHVTVRSPPRTRRPTDAEIDRVIAFHERQKYAGVDLPAVLGVLRVLPLRAGELMKVEWADLDPTQRTVVIRERKHPNAQVRESNHYVLPLPVIGGVDTFALIAGRPRFLPKPFPFRRESVSSTFCYCAQRAGIEDLHLHDLRAFAISKLLEAGVPIAVVAHLSGHKSWKLLQNVYTRLDPVAVREAVERRRRDGLRHAVT